MSSQASVVVVGSVNVDLVANVETLPRPGQTVIGGTFERHWGGKGANQAVAAARYGADVTFVGAVGDDDLGTAAIAALNDEGIDTSATIRVAGETTGVALIVVDRDGQNQIAVASGANLRLGAERLHDVLAAKQGPGVVLTCFEVPDDAVAEVRAAATAGWTVVVNPAPARTLDPRLRDSGAILTPNQGELHDLTGIKDLVEAARSLVTAGPGGPVVVTLGERGALLVTAEDAVEVAAPQVVARDATGAGDVFNGVFAAALAQGETMHQAVCSGVAAATYAVELPGARAQLSRAELGVRRSAEARDGHGPATGSGTAEGRQRQRDVA
jgi:ribokinase